MDGLSNNNLSSESNEPSSQKQPNGLDAKGDEQLANSKPNDEHRSESDRSEDGHRSDGQADTKSNEVSSNEKSEQSNEHPVPEDAEVRSEDQKSSDQLVNGVDKNSPDQSTAGLRVQLEDDQSSNYESLNEVSLDRENHKDQCSTGSDQQEANQDANQKAASQEETEFVEVFGNPDLLKRIIKKGDETVIKPERNCEVLINLEVRNQETGELIESESEQSLSVLVGDFDVIHGVDLALLTMHIDEVAEILVKPLVGYGPMGKQPDIPPNCFLLCKTELLKITRPHEMVCESLDALHHYFRMTKRKKERGNFFFERQEFTIAQHCYMKSGEILDFLGQEMVNRHHMLTDCQSKVADEERKNELTDELASINELSTQYMKVKLDVFNNLSWVCLKMKLYNKALEHVENSLRIDPKDKKALYRKSIILSHRGSVEEAIHTLQDALKLDPENKMFRNELSKLKVKLKKEIKEEKALYAKMLQTKKKKSKKEKQGSDQHLKYLATGLVIGGVVLGGVLLYRKFTKS